jgi:hypothetical protein
MAYTMDVVANHGILKGLAALLPRVAIREVDVYARHDLGSCRASSFGH